MGTRSLTYVFEGDQPILCLYRQYDGYVAGHGREVAEFLRGNKVVNGLSLNPERVFNGMGCLAASLVAHFKTAPGGFYIHAPVLGRDDWQDYEYHIYKDKIRVIKCYDKEVIFLGSWESFVEFCSVEETV
mgnify:CR=1 FL=1